MTYEAPGVRVKKVATSDIISGQPAVEGNIVGWATKVAQLGRWQDPTQVYDDAGATPDATPLAKVILEDEEFVLMVGGVHELVLDGGLTGVEEGDRLWISEDNQVKTIHVSTDYPLGVVQSIDTGRGTWDVARVNTNAWQAFETEG